MDREILDSKAVILGKAIRSELRQKGMKQADFAKKLGITPSRLSNYITGNRMPDIFMLSNMANVLSVSLDSFCCSGSVSAGDFPKRYLLVVYEDGAVRIEETA